ncbi:helix-turn-helix domain-containing protein [Patescibacteria group bacterium]|nr:helix-turn-helix domain-containing protein [Patescibacteria group bacterium]MBU1758663.1 helix-turn-helix domain-containing protein [Patescibacteria group bacterium]
MLREIRPDLELFRYKPDGEIISLVRKAIRKLGKKSLNYGQDGLIKVKPIFEELDKEFSYADIRLALLFI